MGRPVSAEPAAVDLRVATGNAASFRSDSWVAITLEATNHGGDYRGHALVQAAVPQMQGPGGAQRGGVASCSAYGECPPQIRTPSGPPQTSTPSSPPQSPLITYRVPVVLAAGGSKRIPLTIGPGLGHLHVDLVDDSGGAVTAVADENVGTASFPLQSGNGAAMAAVSDADAAIDSLGTVQLPAVTPVTAVSTPPQCTNCGDLPEITASFIRLRPAELPDSAMALSGLAAVVLDGSATSGLGQAQQQALADYVDGGGLLVTTGGPGARSLVTQLPRGLVPVTITGQGSSTLPSLSLLLDAPPLTVPVDLALVGDHRGTVTYSDGPTPLVVESSRGLGHTVFMAVNPSVEPLRSWAGTRTLLRRVLLHAHARSTPLAAQNGAINQRSSNLQSSITSIGAINLPSSGTLGWLLAVYVLLVGPVSFLVLARLRRHDLMWLTVPAIALVAAVLAYGTGLGSNRHDAVANTIRVATLAPGSHRAYVESFTAVYLPHGGTQALQLSGQPYVSNLNGIVSPGHPTIVDEESDRLLLDGPPASVQGYSTVEYRGVPGGLTQRLSLAAGRLRGAVVNDLPVGLTDLVLIRPGAGWIQLAGSLAPGASLPIDAPLSSTQGNQAPTPFLGPCAGDCSTTDPQLREQMRRRSLIQGLIGYTGNYSASMGRPMLVALTRRRLLPEGVRGDNVEAGGLDAIMVPLEADDSSGTATTVATTVIGHPQSATSSYRGLPSTTLPAGRPEVFEFMLPGTAMRKIQFTMSGLNLVAGGPGAASPTLLQPRTLSVEIHNVRTGSWDPLPGIIEPFGGSAVVTDPQPYVGADGSVLLRLTSPVGGESINNPRALAVPMETIGQ